MPLLPRPLLLDAGPTCIVLYRAWFHSALSETVRRVAGKAREANTAYRRAFGERLRELRLERAISQERLALDAGIARSYLGGIERGEKNPALDHLVKLAVTLRVEPRDLLPPLAPAATTSEM